MEDVRRFLIYAVLIIAVMYLAVCVLAFVSQRSLMYYPQPRANRDAATMVLPSFAGPVLVSTRPAHGSAAVIYFGGNAEDVSLDLPDLSSLFPDDAIYLLHYPGYGGSAGHPNEKSILTAAFALFDSARIQHPEVTIIGRSLGTGVAIQVASRRPVARLILVTPYDSLADVAEQHYPLLPIRWLMLDKYDSWKYAPQVTAPTKFIVAGQDEVIPRTSTERLRTRFTKARVAYVVVPGVGHNTISDSPDYLRLLKEQ